MYAHNIAIDEQGNGTVTWFPPTGPVTIDSTHPSFPRVTSALMDGQDPTPFMDLTEVVAKLDDRVSIIDDVVHFDGEPIHNHLTNTIVRYFNEGRDTANLVKFMELLDTNPSRRSREQLFAWAQAKDLTIDPDGFIVGYKGVNRRPEPGDDYDDGGFPLDKYPYQSSHKGHGFVDGVEITNDHLPQGIGTVLTIPRNEVQDDPNIGCHVGLHVGSYSYASTFAQVLIEVRFSPADVVSVPTELSHQKLRCCRYEVIDVHEPEVGDDLSQHEPEATWDDDEVFDTLTDRVPEASKGFIDKLRDRFRN